MTNCCANAVSKRNRVEIRTMISFIFHCSLSIRFSLWEPQPPFRLQTQHLDGVRCRLQQSNFPGTAPRIGAGICLSDCLSELSDFLGRPSQPVSKSMTSV